MPQVRLHAEGFEHLLRRGVTVHRRLFDDQGIKITTRVVERWIASVEPRDQAARIVWRLLLRTTEQVALYQVDTHFDQYQQFLDQLNAFGNHLGA